jgi:outer membrane beta-barrel protein
METGIRVFLLAKMLTTIRNIRTAALLCASVAVLSGCGLFGGSKEPPPLGAEAEEPVSDASSQPVIEPQVERREVKAPGIDNENFEAGGYVGIISIEDFGTSSVFGGRLAYHISEDLFLEGSFGMAEAGTTSYERMAGGAARLLADEDREYTYYALNIGWNALPGEIFIGKNRAYNSAFYLSVGVGGTEFAGDNRFTLNGGVGYRVLITDWIAVHFDFRDYLFDIDILGEKKVAHNLEGSLGITAFF